ncbi:MAG TPA: hypothetical protein VF152_07935 [Acidimicrobiia bacterium]
MRRLRSSLLVGLVAVALASACSRGSGGSTSSATPAGQAAPTTVVTTTTGSVRGLEVTEHTEELVDASRPTQAPVAAPDRTLTTTIRYPTEGGPYPLIVFAHGFDGHPRKFVRLTTVWAQAGYVVAVPRFPLTNDDIAEGVLADVHEQPADVSFVIDEMLRLDDEPGSAVAGRIDEEHIGVAGLSLGGITTLAVAYNGCCRDDRLDAAIPMASIQYPFPGEYELTDVPLLLFHGDADPVIPHGSSAETFAAAAAPKFFVTILGGGHAQPFEDVDDPADEMVQAVTTDFWDLELKDQPAALDRLLADAEVPGLTAVQYAAG